MKRMEYRHNARQNLAEHDRYIGILQREGVRSFLEVGSKVGGALWRVARALPKGARVVSVDLPWGDRKTQPHLEACVAELKSLGYDAHLFLGDSTSPEIIAGVRALGPFDAVFIDANHTLPYVTADWETYGPMSRIVAFHDIAWARENFTGTPIDVPHFWPTIRDDFRHEEIIEAPGNNGIGVLWRC